MYALNDQPTAKVLPFRKPKPEPMRVWVDDFDFVPCTWHIVSKDMPDQGFLVAEQLPFEHDYQVWTVTRDIPEFGWLKAIPVNHYINPNFDPFFQMKGEKLNYQIREIDELINKCQWEENPYLID